MSMSISHCVCVSVKELLALHDKHLNRPTMDDSVDEEHAIEIQTQQITQVRFQYSEILLLLPKE